MPETFGARLRQQREARQIDLVAISEQTKIKLALLEALEHDDVSHWPSGIFRRAYIRAYGQFIGLDPDAVLREFLEAHPDPSDQIVSTAADAAAAEEQYARQAPSMRFRSIVDSALGSFTRLRRSGAPEVRPAPAIPAPVSMPHELEDMAGLDLSGHIPTHEAHEASGQPIGLIAEADDAGLVHVDVEAPAAFAAHDLEEPVLADHPRKAEVAIEEPVERVELIAPPAAQIVEAPPQTQEAPAVALATDSRTEEKQREKDDEMLETVARLCTEFGRVIERGAVRELLQDSAATLNAAGLIVWLADETGDALRPGLVHGYSEKVLAHIPAVARDADNATAAAFRSAKPCEVAATVRTPGALVVPLLIPDGCAGVLAIELQHGVKPSRSLRAVAVLLAAALTQLVHRSRPAERSEPIERPAASERHTVNERQVQAVAQFRAAARPMKVRR